MLADPVTGKPKSVSVSRLPVEQCLLDLSTTTSSSSSSVTDKKKKKQKLLAGADAAASSSLSLAVSPPSVDMAGLAKAYAAMVTTTKATTAATTATVSKKKSAAAAASVSGLGTASSLPAVGDMVPGILLFSDFIAHHHSQAHHHHNHGRVRIPQPPALILSLGQVSDIVTPLQSYYVPYNYYLTD